MTVKEFYEYCVKMGIENFDFYVGSDEHSFDETDIIIYKNDNMIAVS